MAVISCKFCFQMFSVDKKGEYECPHCHQKQEVTLEAKESRSIVPWEDRKSLGFFPALKENWLQSTFNMTSFYSRLAPHGSIKDALYYALILMSLSGVISVLISTVIQSAFYSFMSPNSPVSYTRFGSFFQLLYVFVIPFLSALYLIIYCGIYHFFLKIFGGTKHGIAATFRVLCYSQSPVLFSVVPILGGLVSLIWHYIALVIGIREVHETSTEKSLMALLVPLLLSCLVGGATIFFIVTMFLKNWRY